jgi:hypothetical protein
MQGGVPQWLYFGNYISSIASADKSDLKIEFVGHSYYNDSNADQDSMTIIRFKTGSKETSPFKGNGIA